MQRIRIFKSALNNVRYAAGYPLTVGEYLRLPPKERRELEAKVQG